jgi:hypothetical protein
MQTIIKLAFSLFMAILLVTISSISVIINQEVQAQRDTFKVNVYLNNVSYKTGDVDVWVTLDSTGITSSTGAINPMRYSSIGPFEFDASEIRVGETFSACVYVLSTGEINCVSGKNSPAKKPEVVYLTVPGQYYSLPQQSPPQYAPPYYPPSPPSQNLRQQGDINWEDLCNQFHFIVGLEHDCNDLADGTNLTPKGERILLCLAAKGLLGLINIELLLEAQAYASLVGC